MIFLYHIRRTAGRTLFNTLASRFVEPHLVDGLAHRGTCNVDGKVIAAGYWTKNPSKEAVLARSHRPAHDVVIPDNAITVTVLRHPADRVISLYRMLLNLRESGAKTPWRLPDGDTISQYSWLGKNILDFAYNLPKDQLLAQLYHFSVNYNIDEAVEFVNGIDYVLHFDQLYNGIAELEKGLGLGQLTIHTTRYPHFKSVEEKISKELENSVRLDIEQLVQKETIFVEKLQCYL